MLCVGNKKYYKKYNKMNQNKHYDYDQGDNEDNDQGYHDRDVMRHYE